jgi:putative transposase
MPTHLPRRLLAAGRAAAQALRRRPLAATRPAAAPRLSGAVADPARTRPELRAEHALLRQRLLLRRRHARRPRCAPAARALPLPLAGRRRPWRRAVLLVQPDTLLRRHRRRFRWHRRRRSGATRPANRPPLAPATIALLRGMAASNRPWGAERIRGAPLRLGLRVAKSTSQQYLRQARPPRPAGQPWATLPRHQADAIRAGACLPVTDLRFRPLCAFFAVALGSRRVVHAGVARRPTDAGVAQQLREATPCGPRPG